MLEKQSFFTLTFGSIVSVPTLLIIPSHEKIVMGNITAHIVTVLNIEPESVLNR